MRPKTAAVLAVDARAGAAALLAYFGTDDGLALAAIPFTLITP